MVFFSAYFLMYQSYSDDPNPMDSPMESIITVFILSLGGNIANVWEELDSTEHSFVGKVGTWKEYELRLCADLMTPSCRSTLSSSWPSSTSSLSTCSLP